MQEETTSSPEQTQAFAKKLAEDVPAGSTLCFFGELGAGKTTFIKGFVGEIVGEAQVSSPTFTYLNVYKGKKIVYHFDLYRLTDQDEFLGMGFDEFLGGEGIACIEWSEKIKGIIPPDAMTVRLEHLGENKRKIIVK